LRLLILGHNYAPEVLGIGPYTTGLAEHFEALGDDVTVLTTFPHYPNYKWQGRPGLYSRELLAGVVVRRLRAILPKKRSAVWRVVFDTSVGVGLLVNSIGVSRPDLIISVIPTLQSGLAGGILGKVWRVPSILLVHDFPLEAGLAVGMLRPGTLQRLGARFERFVYGLGTRIVVIGDRFRENLLAKRINEERISIISNWIELDETIAAKPDPDMHRQLAGSADAFLVLHTGTMAEKQGLSNVIEASRVLADDPTITTVLVGDGPTKSQLVAAIVNWGLTNIRILGVQPGEDYLRILGAADVLLLNQRRDVVDAVVPSKLLHYMAAGRAIIAAVNEASVAADLILDAKSGVLVSPEDPGRLADAIRNIRDNPQLRQRLGSNGREYAERKFAKSAIMEQWDRLVADVVTSVR
jgi:glycosyltransferase involved in cell wall biosynthesis